MCTRMLKYRNSCNHFKSSVKYSSRFYLVTGEYMNYELYCHGKSGCRSKTKSVKIYLIHLLKLYWSTIQWTLRAAFFFVTLRHRLARMVVQHHLFSMWHTPWFSYITMLQLNHFTFYTLLILQFCRIFTDVSRFCWTHLVCLYIYRCITWRHWECLYSPLLQLNRFTFYTLQILQFWWLFDIASPITTHGVFLYSSTTSLSENPPLNCTIKINLSGRSKTNPKHLSMLQAHPELPAIKPVLQGKVFKNTGRLWSPNFHFYVLFAWPQVSAPVLLKTF